MKLAVVFILFATIGFAEDAQRPVCNKSTHGQFWPAEANGDREVAGRLIRQGELEMCSYDTWKYRWKPMSVSVRNLSRDKRAPDTTSVAESVDTRVVAAKD